MANVILYDSFLSKVSDIATYSRNARQHSDEQIAQIVRSITEFGFTSPVLLDENGVLIAGHGRLAAARQLGMEELPAIAIEGLNDAQKQALRLADNKLALNASWDDDLLRTELMDLRDVGFDLGLTGFGEQELAGLFADMNGPHRPRRGAGAASGAGDARGRRVDARTSSAGVRGCHERGARGETDARRDGRSVLYVTAISTPA
jgi:hypothetical protein